MCVCFLFLFHFWEGRGQSGVGTCVCRPLFLFWCGRLLFCLLTLFSHSHTLTQTHSLPVSLLPHVVLYGAHNPPPLSYSSLQAKNEAALSILYRILNHTTWINVHTLPHSLHVSDGFVTFYSCAIVCRGVCMCMRVCVCVYIYKRAGPCTYTYIRRCSLLLALDTCCRPRSLRFAQPVVMAPVGRRMAKLV